MPGSIRYQQYFTMISLILIYLGTTEETIGTLGATTGEITMTSEAMTGLVTSAVMTGRATSGDMTGLATRDSMNAGADTPGMIAAMADR